MPCHAAALSIGDIPSAAAIIIFLAGIISMVFMWLASGKSHSKNDGLKLTDFISAVESLIFDGLFQRRLLKVSLKRWIIHEMIFFPFIIRFLWGIISLALSLLNPEWDITWMMLDKNNPVAGLIFDITGLFILMGGCLIVIEKKRDKKLQNIKDLPKSNILVNALLGGMIITGFIVEGARIAMTGSPEGSQFAFLGYLISRALLNYHLNGIYAYLWYLHAVLTAVFILCLPFSRMFHIFTAPLSLLLRGASKE
jgi:nitrate reductase gamma subunit